MCSDATVALMLSSMTDTMNARWLVNYYCQKSAHENWCFQSGKTACVCPLAVTTVGFWPQKIAFTA